MNEANLRNYELKLRRGPLVFGASTLVMGILNATPDSFYDGGTIESPAGAADAAEKMAEAGAEIIDVGGESTRPGSLPVPVEEELRRTAPAVEAIRARLPGIAISIDTSKARVAEACLEAGADIVNDVTAFRGDPEMAATAARFEAPAVLMHMLGAPRDMQNCPAYPEGVMAAIVAFFRERIEAAAWAGVPQERLILDPGIGFGKTVEHNLQILKRLGELREFGLPLLVGASRKSFIGKTLDLEPVERLEGSLASVAAAILNGAAIVRVHDVRESVRVARLIDAIRNAP